MPVYRKQEVRPSAGRDDYQRGELVNTMMARAAGFLPPERWLEAAKAALAVANDLYPEEGVSNG